MKKAFPFVLVLLFAVMAFFAVPDMMSFVQAAPEIGPYDLVVSPDGSDSNAGTLASPLKTVKAAKDKLKAQKETVPDGTRRTPSSTPFYPFPY